MHFNKPNHPILIFIRGLPGSGKSYAANALAEQFGRNQVVELDPDAIDLESQDYKKHSADQLAEGTNPKLLPYRYLRSQAYKGIEDGKIVIWNQPFTNLDIFNVMVGRLKDHADKHGVNLPILVVEVETDHDTAKSRIERRRAEGGHGPSHEKFNKFVDEYNTAASHGYVVATINGGSPVDESTKRIVEALNQLLNS